MKRYFAYSADDGYTTFETEADAKAYAERCLELYEEAAKYEGEWPEETDSVVWGKILAKAVCVRTKTRDWQYKLKEME